LNRKQLIMGWTSFTYRTTDTNTTLSEASALDILRQDLSVDILAHKLVKATQKGQYNELYFIADTPGGEAIGVALIELRNGEAFIKLISESMGPAYYNCPTTWFNRVPLPDGEYAKKWRMQHGWDPKQIKMNF